MQVTSLHEKFDALHRRHGAATLCSIYGAGLAHRPAAMLVFMNPTGRNISAHPAWHGLRAPWLGTKDVWPMFAALGFLNPALVEEIRRAKSADWTDRFGRTLYRDLAAHSVFVTNLAKCTQVDARPLPDRIFRDYLELFQEEVLTVRPRRIITFGNQVSSVLLGRPVRVSAYRGAQSEKLIVSGETFAVYPVYYPVGQGKRNMPAAIRRIKKIMGKAAVPKE